MTGLPTAAKIIFFYGACLISLQFVPIICFENIGAIRLHLCSLVVQQF
jgi:hypothetical protein